MATTPQHGRHGALYRLRPGASASNMAAESCLESGSTAQIEAVARRILNPNAPPVFTDSGGAQLVSINYTNGFATFAEGVATVTATGTGCYYAESELTKVGYLTDWSLNVALDLADSSYMGQAWKNYTPGQAGVSGSAAAFFIGDDSFIDGIENKEYFFLELFTYDPDQDQTGDHFRVWVLFNSTAINASVGDVVKESLDFTAEGAISYKDAT